MSEKFVVTAALPYANGKIHIGHLLEYIQADIFARFLKLQGKDCLYVCASDMHGTPIEVNAKKAGILPEKFVEIFWQEHQKDFASFLIHFDNYYKTHSPENKELAEWFFQELKKKGHIYTKEVEQMYDTEAKQFLPDRFVKGTCPKCKAEDQYGDVCEACGATYNTTDLIKPYSTLTKSKPVLKKSVHYFFRLSSFSKELRRWISDKKNDLQEEIRNFVLQWLNDGLQDWCISRDVPYFGFPIPDSKAETGALKYFYVWLDAPIGYISSTKNLCDKHKTDWREYWYGGKVHHFIGKDIMYFHFLFWPAMLMAVGIPLPDLTVHGFITINGRKMSKSRGTFFTAKDFLQLYEAEALRFYYASHLAKTIVDVDLNFADFQAVTNNVLMGNLGNFCYRTLIFAATNYESFSEIADETQLQEEVYTLISQIEAAYLARDYKTAVRQILTIADLGNQYFQKAEPWAAKEAKQAEVGFCVALARNLAILVQPILPQFSEKVLAVLGEQKSGWGDLGFSWHGTVKKPEKLVAKIETIPEEKVEETREIEYTVNDDVKALGVKVRLAQLTGLQIRKKSGPVEKLKRNIEKKSKDYKNEEILKAYEQLHKKTGINPQKDPHALHNLFSLIEQKGRLPQINTVVDIYNLMSLKSGILMATHDFAKLKGSINIRLSHQDEAFVSLDSSAEKLADGEIIYADIQRVIGRFSKQCKATMTTIDSHNIVLVCFGNKNIDDNVMDKILKETSELITRHNGGSYKIIPEKFPIRIRIGRIIKVKEHPKAKKLYLMKVDFGDEQRQVVAGLKDYLSPEELTGKVTTFCVNLTPATLRGEVSEAMTMIAEDKAGRLTFLQPVNKKVGDYVECAGMKSLDAEITLEQFTAVKLVVRNEKIIADSKELIGVIAPGVKGGAKVR